jgi:predicted ATPase
MLVEDHVLVPGEQGWRVHPDQLVHLHVPATLTGVIQARLDGLPAQERAVLQRAAVVGRVFWDAAVAFLDQKGPPDHGVLDDLQKREIVFRHEPSAFSDATEYIFKHSILRDVTYESVLIRTRKAYHGLIADWLIAHSGEWTREMPGLIAGHLEKAGREDEALAYLCRAAEAAAANYANDEAADFYTRALAIAPQEDLERRFHLLLGQERIWSAKGNLVAQRQVLDELDEITQSLADGRKRAEVTLRRAWYAFWRSDFEATLAASQQALTLGESMADPKLVGQAHYAVAWAFLHLKETDQALRHAHMALQAARRAHDRRSEGNILNILGLSSIALGEFAQARDHLEQFLAVAQELGDRERELTSSSNLGVALMFLGDFRAAGERFHHTLRLARQSGDRTSEGTALVNLAWAKGSQGDWAEAVQYAEAGLTSKRQFEQAEAIAEALLWLAHAQSGLGQFDDALAAYRESLAIRMELGQTHLAMGVHAGLARAWLTQGDLTAAMIHAEEITAFLADGGSLEGTWEPLRIRLSCFRVLQAAQDPRAPAMLEGAYHILQARAAKIPSEADRRIFVENIPWHREILAAWQDR